MTILHLYTRNTTNHHICASACESLLFNHFASPKGLCLKHHWIHSIDTSSQVAKVPKSIRLCRVGSHPQKQPDRQQIMESHGISFNMWPQALQKGNPRASPCLHYYTAQLGARDRLPPGRTFDLKKMQVQVQVESRDCDWTPLVCCTHMSVASRVSTTRMHTACYCRDVLPFKSNLRPWPSAAKNALAFSRLSRSFFASGNIWEMPR